MSVTPNRGLPLMEPSQSEPEVLYNEAMVILDSGTSLEVEQSGHSPGVFSVSKIKFHGADVNEESPGVVVVSIDPASGGGGGGSLELTDGTHDLTGVTKITVSGATVGGTAGAATLTVTGGGGGAGVSVGASVYKTSNQSVANANPAVSVTWDAALFDTSSFYSGGNPTRLTAPVTGIYLISASVIWDVNGAGFRQLYFQINGAGAHCITNLPAGSNNTGSNLTTALSLTAGDYVEVNVYQNSGGALNILASAQLNSFSMVLAVPSNAAKVSGASIVAALPASPAQGDRAFVTDATATTFLSTVAGSGSDKVPVVYDGTNWVIG